MSGRLLLDLGNTRLKWALAQRFGSAAAPADGWRLGEVKALAHAGPDFLPALQQALRQLPEVDSVHLVAVASASMLEAVQHCVREHVHSRRPGPIRAHTQARMGVGAGRQLICGYPQPDHLGADRWLSLCGALVGTPPPLLVVGAGTALTLDAVDSEYRHLGGLILAGIAGMREGLLLRAPHLQVGTRRPGPSDFWADDTAPAVAMAPWQAAAGLIERAARRMQGQSGQAPEVILAGGDAEALAPLLDRPARVEPHLVLKGLLQASISA